MHVAALTTRFICIAALATTLISGCSTLSKAVKSPELTLSNAQITAMSLADMQVAFDVDMKNPNPFGLSMQGLSYTLHVQDKAVALGALNQKLDLPAEGSTQVRLPFSLRYEDMLGTLSALRDKKEVSYRISGEVDFGLMRLPYSRTGTLALPSLPKVSIENLKIKRMSVTSVDVAVALKIDNLNNFPVKLDGMDYQLKLANASFIKGAANSPLALQPNQQGQLVLDLSLDYAQVNAVMQALQSGTLPVEFNSQLKLPNGKGENTLPYNFKGSVPLKQ